MHEATTLAVTAAGQTVEAKIEDISIHGLKLSLSRHLPPVEDLTIEHRTAGTFAVRRAWGGGTTAGVQFQVTGTQLEHTLRCVRLVLSPDRVCA